MSNEEKYAGKELCMLCGEKLEQHTSLTALNQLYRLKCPRCGEYNITDETSLAVPNHFVKERFHLISAVARWKSERGQRLSVDRKLLEDRSEFEARILSVCPRTTQEKMDHIITYIAEKSEYSGHRISFNTIADFSLLYCKSEQEVRFLFNELKRDQLIYLELMRNSSTLRLTAEGWQRAEELAKPNIESKQAFVAMWFDDQMTSAYSEGIAKLEEDTGFTMLRIDMSEFNDKICDKILAEIRRSRFLIADVTGQRQGVYFEAGFAMGLGLPVIWTCREDQIKDCHFDTRQYNHIPWNNVEELREKLRNRILATIGQAPK
jgi:nucleoside 2-deoxyribosyltransferase